MAQDETLIDRVYHLDRGYERIEEKLKGLEPIFSACAKQCIQSCGSIADSDTSEKSGKSISLFPLKV